MTPKQKLLANVPLMKCGNAAEFRQRLQWLSEGMLANHLNSVLNYTISEEEIRMYRAYKLEKQK